MPRSPPLAWTWLEPSTIYLHLMQIHRDINGANILLDSLPGNGKVFDYRLVNLLRELCTIGPGSPVFAAPEASVPAKQSPRIDISSFGD